MQREMRDRRGAHRQVPIPKSRHATKIKILEWRVSYEDDDALVAIGTAVFANGEIEDAVVLLAKDPFFGLSVRPRVLHQDGTYWHIAKSWFIEKSEDGSWVIGKPSSRV